MHREKSLKIYNIKLELKSSEARHPTCQIVKSYVVLSSHNKVLSDGVYGVFYHCNYKSQYHFLQTRGCGPQSAAHAG